MQRRDFLAAVGGAATWAMPAQAQKKLPVIAFLNSGAADASASKALMSLTEAGLRDVGLVQGQDYVFVTRWANGDPSNLSRRSSKSEGGRRKPGKITSVIRNRCQAPK